MPILQQLVKNASLFKFASESKFILAGAQVLGENRLGEHVVNYSSGLGFLDHISLNLGEGELSCELVYGCYSAAPVGDQIRQSTTIIMPSSPRLWT